MLSRFNGVHESGTLDHPFLPQNATRDSLFGNRETFSGLANVFPGFKLIGLDPATRYQRTCQASRTGVGDNRETGYTVQGAGNNYAVLNLANNILSTVTVSNVAPSAARDLTISLAPTASNNNANHFTYLGALRLTAATPPRFQPPAIANGEIKLEWNGAGQLEWAASLNGPWTPIIPLPTSPYTEAFLPGQTRFFRIVTAP